MTTEQENILELFNNDYTELAEILSKSTGNESWFEEYITSQIDILKKIYVKHFKTNLPDEEYRKAVFDKSIKTPYNFKIMARRLGFSNRMTIATINNYNFANELYENETTKRFKIDYS